MSGSLDFTGQLIQDTYQRVTQYSGSYLYTGTGSLITDLNLTSSQALTASFAENVNLTTRSIYTLIASQSQTDFTIATGSDFLDVFINGALLIPSEYSVSGSQLTVNSFCDANDEVNVLLYYNTSIIDLPAEYTTKHDFSGSYSYCGRAVYGTSE